MAGVILNSNARSAAVAGRRLLTTLGFALCVVACLSSVAAAGQGRPNRPRGQQQPGPLADGGVSPAELQRLFDAYVVMQAQQELQLTDEQYPRFLSSIRALQDVRRRGQMERGRLLQSLRRLSQDTAASEKEMGDQLKGLDALDERQAVEIRKAVAAVDQVLDVRQQARFRLFEEMMERRKVDLLLRARQTNRRSPQ